MSIASSRGVSTVAELYKLLSVGYNAPLAQENAAREDCISRSGHQRREQKGVWYRCKADFLASTTDLDPSAMKRRDSKGSHLGYYTHYVVDGGKARIILGALVTPFEVTENQPMLDLLWRTQFLKVSGQLPRSRATFGTGHSASEAQTNRTASSWNSGGSGGLHLPIFYSLSFPFAEPRH